MGSSESKAKGSFGQKEFDIQLSDIPRVISLAYNGRSFYNIKLLSQNI